MTWINTWEGALPKTFPDTDETLQAKAELLMKVFPVSDKQNINAPLVELNQSIQHALFIAHKDQSLVRGIDNVETLLNREKAGLDKLAKMDNSSAPRRISRLLILSNDCAPRLYEKAAAMLLQNRPRLACIVLDADSSELCRKATGKPGTAKLLLVSGKNALNLVLKAILRSNR